MPRDDQSAFVAEWLKPSGQPRSGRALLELLEAAMGALYATASFTLSDVTLHAVLDRVVLHARERFPAFDALQMTKTGVSTAKLRKGSDLAAREAAELVEFVLVEFLTVLGSLTADILTPRLHAALTRLGAAPPRGRGRRGKTREAKKK